MLLDVIGGIVAFACAMAATYVDCYQVIRKTSWRVPDQFWRSLGLLLLASGCGGLAAGAFFYSVYSDVEYINSILGANIPNHIVRGFYTGVAVLALIRSKVFQVKGADIGVEYAYVEIRSICLRGVNVSWTAARNAYVSARIGTLLQLLQADTSFDDQLYDLVKAAVDNADDKTRTSVESQLTNVRASKPQSVPSIADRAWASYARAVLNLVMENCGTAALEKVMPR